jgi:ArsR family transcriptional regulator
MRDAARIFKALADETRLQVLALILNAGELCVCDCMQVLAITQSKASRHLRYLANAGLLVDRREAVWVYYRIAEPLDRERQAILDAVRSVLPAQRVQELLDRLDEWRRRKETDGPGCSPSPSVPPQGGNRP